MHLYNRMHRHFLDLIVTVWGHIGQGLGSSITVKSSTASCFHIFVWAVLEFTAQRMLFCDIVLGYICLIT